MSQVNAKYMSAGHPFLTGTDSGPTYLVVAQDPNSGALLGVKPLVQGLSTPKGQLSFVGLRFRLVPNTEKVAGIDEKPKFAAPADWPNAFSGFAWQKSDTARRSCVYGVVLSRGAGDAWMAPYDLEALDFYSNVLNWLSTRIPRKAWTTPPETLTNFLHDFVDDFFSAHAAPVQISAKKKLEKVQGQIVALAAQVPELEALAAQEAASGETPKDPKDLVTATTHLVPDFSEIKNINATIQNQIVSGGTNTAAAPKTKPNFSVVAGLDLEDDDNGGGPSAA